MSASGGPFWRAAGMSYLRFANVCSELMVTVMKEPFKSKAKAQQVIHYRSFPWADGKQGKQGACKGRRRTLQMPDFILDGLHLQPEALIIVRRCP